MKQSPLQGKYSDKSVGFISIPQIVMLKITKKKKKTDAENQDELAGVYFRIF